MTKEQDKALAMDLCRIIKPLAHEIISAIGDNRVLICIQPHAGICADINGSKYLVSWTDTYEKVRLTTKIKKRYGKQQI